MGRTACTELQCLYMGALYLLPLLPRTAQVSCEGDMFLDWGRCIICVCHFCYRRSSFNCWQYWCALESSAVYKYCGPNFLLRFQGVWNKTCIQLSLSQILFQNPKNYSLGYVQRFFYHSWCDSTVIFDQISNSSNIYFSSSRFWTAISLDNFYQLPSVSESRIPPKTFYRSSVPFP